ncbi:14940_t:CDS:2 [Gigaspora rosea]|nr:14940_t:CDS:2 [Gigaspora rosea]
MQLITRPAHSIINQSFDSRLRLDTLPVNGDGFGVGWYQSNPNTTSTPCIFTSITPAWNNQNLSRLAEEIQSSLVFAHVRASTTGALSETNYELFLFVQGNTDSEWAFALFLNQLEDPINGQFDHEMLKIAMLKTIDQLNNWAEEAGIHESSLLNFAVTDGHSVICTRYINRTRFTEYKPGHYKMTKADKREDIVLVASGTLLY